MRTLAKTIQLHMVDWPSWTIDSSVGSSHECLSKKLSSCRAACRLTLIRMLLLELIMARVFQEK